MANQYSLFQTKEDIKEETLHHVSDALDSINNKYGEFTVTSARMMKMDDIIVDRIAFGGIREIDNLYKS